MNRASKIHWKNLPWLLTAVMCQNSRLVKGFHPLFHKSVVAPLFHPLSPTFTRYWGCSKMPLGPLGKMKKRNLLPHQKWPWGSNFCETNFQEFRLKWWRKELFLHCGDELNGIDTWEYIVNPLFSHGNVIFDIFEPSAFQKYSICWVFEAFFCSTFFTCYFAIQPRPALTAVHCSNLFALIGSLYWN